MNRSHFTIPCAYLLAPLVLLLAPPSLAQSANPSTPDSGSPQGENWMDSGHDRVIQSADGLATWADNFFGNPQSDLEATATSRIRLRPEFEWDEEDDTDWKLKATGRIWLPKVSERLSLVFLGQEDDFEGEFYDPALSGDGDSTVGFQYQVREKTNSRIDLIAGMKSGPKGKVGARYRYQIPFAEKNRLRFSEELFWIGGDGFGTLTRVDVDHLFSEDTLIRWANRAEYSEESNGVEWNTRLAWIRKLDQRSAFRAFGFVRGDTDPELLKSRGFGVAYRRTFLRDWLYWELEPRYAWRKKKTFKDREEVASIRLRIEILFSSE